MLRRAIFGTIALAAWLPSAFAAAPPTVFGGIEIGSKGTKARLFTFKGTGENKAAHELYSKSINTTLVSSMTSGRFTETSIQEAVKAVDTLLGELKSTAAKEKLPEPALFVIGSSAVAKAINKQDLVVAVKQATGFDVTLVDAKTENLGGFIGSVPEVRRDESMLVDTGSGNTTAGCLVDTDYKYAEIPYGSVSLRNTSIDSPDYEGSVKGVIESLIKPAYRKETLGKPCLANRARIYWIGGAAWATATYTHPERSTNAYVSLTKKDIDGFLAKLRDGSWNANQPRITFSEDTPESIRRQVNAAALKDWKSVQNVFVREDLIAGVSLFRTLLDASNPNARVLFVRNGNYLYGYALQKFVEGRTDAVPQVTPKQVSQILSAPAKATPAKVASAAPAPAAPKK